VRTEIRWSEDKIDLERQYATELVALTPDVIVAAGTVAVIALQHIRPTLPIVFVQIADPVGSGIVDSLARPGGNITGFINYEFSIGGKWLDLLKQIAPNVSRAAVIRDSSNPSGIAQFSAVQGAAQSRGVEVSPVGIRDTGEIERGLATFARSANGGLIVTGPAGASVYRGLIIELAARHKLPAVYADGYIVTQGGLISYGPDRIDLYRQAANYVDRILRGEKPADLPVQAPTKYELAINLKTAKALGLNVPQSLLASADQVIE
jgi:putative ABC transport system substrate-binding protein